MAWCQDSGWLRFRTLGGTPNHLLNMAGVWIYCPLQTILHYMVSSGTGQQPTKPSQDVLYLLQRSQLMTSVRWVLLTCHNLEFLKDDLLCSGSALQITSAGFQFLLHSPHAQLWDLLLEYLHMAEVSLRLLTGNWFKYLEPSHRNGAWTLWKSWASCSCCLPWSLVWWVIVPYRVKAHVTHFKSQEYSTENLSQTQQAMLVDLRDYGLVWQREAIISPSITWLRTF
jgi:transcription initiation factor TFIIH subunit 4